MADAAPVEFYIAEHTWRTVGGRRTFRMMSDDLPLPAKILTEGMRDGESVEWVRDDRSVWVLTAHTI